MRLCGGAVGHVGVPSDALAAPRVTPFVARPVEPDSVPDAELCIAYFVCSYGGYLFPVVVVVDVVSTDCLLLSAKNKLRKGDEKRRCRRSGDTQT